MQDFESLIERVASEATPADREKIAELVNPAGTVRIDELTPICSDGLHGGPESASTETMFQGKLIVSDTNILLATGKRHLGNFIAFFYLLATTAIP